MKKIFEVRGMHCRSCEILIEKEVNKIHGVTKAVAKTKKRALFVESESDVSVEVAKAVEAAGYQIGTDELPLVNKDTRHYLELLVSLAAVLVFLWIFRSLQLESLLSPASFASTSLAAAFTIGLTAGVSSCIALVGGLVLGISARHAEKHPEATTMQKFRPHLFFNMGRLLGFFILGGLIGELGSFFRVEGSLLGFFTIAVGVVMIALGIQLTEAFPRLSTAFTLPNLLPKLFKREEKEYSHRNSMLLGAASFFLPCGFTQAMQVYAISTGSFLAGGLIMFFFALGTTPGLLSIGGITASIKKGSFSRLFFKTVGIFVIILAIYNISNGMNLAGIRLAKSNPTGNNGPVQENTKVGPVAPGSSEGDGQSDVQLLKAKYDPEVISSQYVISPSSFTVKVGKPVRLEIYAERDGWGCMGSVMIPGLVNTPDFFQAGKTVVFEFTPTRTGEYQITCAMGIPAGTITIVD